MSRPFAQLPDNTQINAFTRLFQEQLNDTVPNLREFCDSGENVERLINKLVPKPPPGASDPPRNIRGLGISRVQNHRRYVLDLAAARGIITAAEKNDLGINCMDSHSTKATGLLKLLEAITKKAGIRMEGYLPGATPSAPSPTPLPSYSRETGPAPAPAPSGSQSSPQVRPTTPSYSRDSAPAPAPAQTPSYSRDSGPAPAPKPTPSYSRDSGPAPAPTPSYSRDSGPAPPPSGRFGGAGAAAGPAKVAPALGGKPQAGSGTTPRWALVQKRVALEDDRKNKARRLETSLAVYRKCVTDLKRMLGIVSGDAATPETMERLQQGFLMITSPGDDPANPAVALYREIVEKIDPELIDLYKKTGQDSETPEAVPNPADIFREIERLRGEIQPRFTACVTPLQIAVRGLPAKLDELRQSVAAVESNPNMRKLVIDKAHAQLQKLIQLIRVDLPRDHATSKFPQDRAAFNRKEWEDELAPLQVEVETLVKNEERIAQLQGEYQWDCMSLDKDIPVAEGILADRPDPLNYPSANEWLRRLSDMQKNIVTTFNSASAMWAELESISGGREISVPTERHRLDQLTARVEPVKQELESTIAELETTIAELEAIAESSQPEETQEWAGGE